MAGQTHIVSTLQQAVAQGKLAHAYLFSGTRGTGKTSTARILAKIILTQGMEEGMLKQQVEESVDDGNLVDLVEIDAASNRGIDDIRGLLEKIQFSPVVAKAKVYIIDEVHMLTREAFNALLKTLEEPPSYAYFILATTELHKIPATIQSRCQRYLFRQINEDDIVTRLKFIAGKESINVDEDALRAIAHHVQGGLRDAISLLDQLRSLEYITLNDVRSRIGESGFEYVEIVMKAVQAGDRQTLLETVRRMEEVGIPLDHFVRLLLGHVRTDLHRNVEQKRSVKDLERMLSVLLDAVRDLRIAPVPGLVIESALLSLCGEDPSPQPSPLGRGSTVAPEMKPTSDAAKAAETPVSQLRQASPPAPAQTSTPIPPVPPVPTTPPRSSASSDSSVSSDSSLSLSSIKNAWHDIVQSAEPASARMSLKNAALRGLEGNTLILGFASSFHREKVMTNEATRSIEAALLKFVGSPITLKTVLDGETTAVPAPPAREMVNLAEAAADVF